jgi:hypothetical protein
VPVLVRLRRAYALLGACRAPAAQSRSRVDAPRHTNANHSARVAFAPMKLQDVLILSRGGARMRTLTSGGLGGTQWGFRCPQSRFYVIGVLWGMRFGEGKGALEMPIHISLLFRFHCRRCISPIHYISCMFQCRYTDRMDLGRDGCRFPHRDRTCRCRGSRRIGIFRSYRIAGRGSGFLPCSISSEMGLVL